MATLKYLSQYFSTTLNVGGGIDDSQTTGIILQSVSGVHDITEPGQICVTYSDPIDTSVAEWIDYTSINGSNELVGAVRGREGFSAHTHLQGATVAFVMSASHHNDVVDLLNGTEAGIKVKTALYDENGNEVIKTPATTSAVNEVTVTNSATGNAVQLSATGGDTNIDLKLVPKGTGALLDKNGDALSPNSFLALQAIINPNFVVNQRGYVSNATLAAGVYGHDRWKAGSGGGDYTFTQLASSTTITIKTGKTLIQVIEPANVIGGNYVLSWTGTAQARFGIDSATPSGAYAASPIAITTQTAGTVMSVEFNEGTLGKVELNSGTVALPFQPKSFNQELQDCRRYGSKATLTGIAFDTGFLQLACNFPIEMRIVPTVYTFYTDGDASANAGYIARLGGADTAVTSLTSISICKNGIGYLNKTGAFTAGGHYRGSVFVEAEL